MASPLANAVVDPADAALILEGYLKIDDPKLNDLEEHQRQGELYLKYKALAPKDTVAMRVFLYMARMAEVGESSAAFRSDLVPIFNKHSARVLAALEAVPELIPRTCEFLGSHFGFEDVPAAGLAPFAKKHRAAIVKALGEPNAKLCFQQMGV